MRFVLAWTIVGSICLHIGSCSPSKKDTSDTSSVPAVENGGDGSVPVKIDYEESARSRELLASCIQSHMPLLDMEGSVQVRALPARINEELQRQDSRLRVAVDFIAASGSMGDTVVQTRWKSYPFWRAVIGVCGQTGLGLKKYTPAGNLSGIKWVPSKEDFILETNDLLLLGVSRRTTESQQKTSREVAVAYSPAAVSVASSFSFRWQLDGKWDSWQQNSEWIPCFGFSRHDLPIPEDAEAVEFSFPVALAGDQIELDVPLRKGVRTTRGDLSITVEALTTTGDDTELELSCSYPLAVSNTVSEQLDAFYKGSYKTRATRMSHAFELMMQHDIERYRVVGLQWVGKDGREVPRVKQQFWSDGRPISIFADFDEGLLPEMVRVSLAKTRCARVNMTVSLKGEEGASGTGSAESGIIEYRKESK